VNPLIPPNRFRARWRGRPREGYGPSPISRTVMGEADFNAARGLEMAASIRSLTGLDAKAQTSRFVPVDTERVVPTGTSRIFPAASLVSCRGGGCARNPCAIGLTLHDTRWALLTGAKQTSRRKAATSVFVACS
jgi:hypothetical protein